MWFTNGFIAKSRLKGLDPIGLATTQLSLAWLMIPPDMTSLAKVPDFIGCFLSQALSMRGE